jgi:hypothetical protein
MKDTEILIGSASHHKTSVPEEYRRRKAQSVSFRAGLHSTPVARWQGIAAATLTAAPHHTTYHFMTVPPPRSHYTQPKGMMRAEFFRSSNVQQTNTDAAARGPQRVKQFSDAYKTN